MKVTTLTASVDNTKERLLRGNASGCFADVRLEFADGSVKMTCHLEQDLARELFRRRPTVDSVS